MRAVAFLVRSIVSPNQRSWRLSIARFSIKMERAIALARVWILLMIALEALRAATQGSAAPAWIIIVGVKCNEKSRPRHKWFLTKSIGWFHEDGERCYEKLGWHSSIRCGGGWKQINEIAGDERSILRVLGVRTGSRACRLTWLSYWQRYACTSRFSLTCLQKYRVITLDG